LKTGITESTEAIRKTFTIEKKHQDHLVRLSVEMMNELGRNISASEALRAVIERDMKSK